LLQQLFFLGPLASSDVAFLRRQQAKKQLQQSAIHGQFRLTPHESLAPLQSKMLAKPSAHCLVHAMKLEFTFVQQLSVLPFWQVMHVKTVPTELATFIQ